MDEIPLARPEGERKGRGLAGGIVGAVGWLASSLGVFAALLYACGYLISVAQLHLLGLGRLMSYGHDYYVQQGGSFLADLGSTLAIGAEPFIVIFMGIGILAFAVSLAWRKSGWSENPVAARSKELFSRASGLWRSVAYVGTLLLLFRYGDPVEFGHPLTLSNVLFVDPATKMDAELADVLKLLLAGDRNGLGAIFEARLLTWVVVALLLLASHYLTAGWRWRRAAMAPFVLLFALYSLLLPMLYGVLKLKVEFPVVMVWPNEEAKANGGEQGFLLNLDESGMVLYDSGKRKVSLRRRDRVDRLDVVGTAPILSGHAAPWASSKRSP